MFSIEPKGHAWFLIAQMCHAVQGMVAGGCDSLYGHVHACAFMWNPDVSLSTLYMYKNGSTKSLVCGGSEFSPGGSFLELVF